MVYGIQNDRLGPLVNEFLTVLKTLYYSPRNLKNTGEKLLEQELIADPAMNHDPVLANYVLKSSLWFLSLA